MYKLSNDLYDLYVLYIYTVLFIKPSQNHFHNVIVSASLVCPTLTFLIMFLSHFGILVFLKLGLIVCGQCKMTNFGRFILKVLLNTISYPSPP